MKNPRADELADELVELTTGRVELTVELVPLVALVALREEFPRFPLPLPPPMGSVLFKVVELSELVSLVELSPEELLVVLRVGTVALLEFDEELVLLTTGMVELRSDELLDELVLLTMGVVLLTMLLELVELDELLLFMD